MNQLNTNHANRWKKKPKPRRAIDTSLPGRALRKARRGDCNGCFSSIHTSLYNPS